MSQGTAAAIHPVFWYQHLPDFLIFLCYLPYSKHSHVLTVAPQIFTRRLEPTGVFAPIVDMEKRMEAGEAFGAGKLQDFTWKQLLDSYSCTECGRCTEACPANLTGKLLSPKQVIVDIRHLMEESTPSPLARISRRDAPEAPDLDRGDAGGRRRRPHVRRLAGVSLLGRLYRRPPGAQRKGHEGARPPLSRGRRLVRRPRRRGGLLRRPGSTPRPGVPLPATS